MHFLLHVVLSASANKGRDQRFNALQKMSDIQYLLNLLHIFFILQAMQNQGGAVYGEGQVSVLALLHGSQMLDQRDDVAPFQVV